MRDYNKLLESQIKKVKERIPEPNRKLILDFIEEDKAKGISEGRMTSEVSQLSRIYSLLGKDFKKVTKKDLISVVNKLKEGREYSENYINQQKITLVKFYEKIGMEKLVKDKKGKTIDFLKANRGKGISVSSKDILTEEEIIQRKIDYFEEAVEKERKSLERDMKRFEEREDKVKPLKKEMEAILEEKRKRIEKYRKDLSG